jgi:branched-chain amino acid transport system permease protein
MSADPAPSDDAVPGVVDAITGVVEDHDTVKVALTLLGVYAIFIGVLFVSQPEGVSLKNAVANRLRFVTFLAAVYVLVTLALNLHWGYTGLFNIGVAGFMAVGVYTMAILTRPIDPLTGPPGMGLPLWVGVVAGMVVAAVVGLVAALPALRLRADYFAIVTLAISEIIRLSLQSTFLDSVLLDYAGVGTNGGSGIRVPVSPDDPIHELFVNGGNIANGPTALGGLFLREVGNTLMFVPPLLGESAALPAKTFLDLMYVAFLGLVVLAFYVFLNRVGRSPFGRVLKAIRGDELVADSLGKNVDVAKIKVFMIGCSLMGLAGILWMGSQGTVSPTPQFRPNITFFVFVAMMLGGAGSNTGSVLGGIVFAGVLFEAPRRLGQLIGTGDAKPAHFAEAVSALGGGNIGPFLAYVADGIAALQFVLLGVVLVLLMYRKPEGLLGHRVEEASPVDLKQRPTATDGGDTDE